MICSCMLPSSTPSRIIIPPISPPFLCGLSEGYSIEFPDELSSKINRKVYEETIADINCLISAFWPCFLAKFLGICCCPCTIGFSLLMPFSCIKDAESTVKRSFIGFFNVFFERFLEYRDIKRLNIELFWEKGLEMKFEKNCCVSWLEIEVFNKEIEFKTGGFTRDYFEEL